MFRPFWGGGMLMGWGGFLWAPFLMAGFVLLVVSSTVVASSLPSIIGLLLIVAGLVVLFGRQSEAEEKTKRKNSDYVAYEDDFE